MSTLAFKFGTLLIKQAAKPVANRVKAFVLTHPAWRQRALDFARVVHKWEVWAASTARSDGRKVVIGEMMDDKAIELASSIVSETVVFSVGALVLFWEYNRSSEANEMKKWKEKQERIEWESRAEEQRETLSRENKAQYDIIRQLQQRVESLEKVLTDQQEQLQRRRWWRRAVNSTTVPEEANPGA